MKKYVIVHGESSDELEEIVENYLNSGWKVCGGVAIGYNPSGMDDYYQAMIKE